MDAMKAAWNSTRGKFDELELIKNTHSHPNRQQPVLVTLFYPLHFILALSLPISCFISIIKKAVTRLNKKKTSFTQRKKVNNGECSLPVGLAKLEALGRANRWKTARLHPFRMGMSISCDRKFSVQVFSDEMKVSRYPPIPKDFGAFCFGRGWRSFVKWIKGKAEIQRWKNMLSGISLC